MKTKSQLRWVLIFTIASGIHAKEQQWNPSDTENGIQGQTLDPAPWNPLSLLPTWLQPKQPQAPPPSPVEEGDDVEEKEPTEVEEEDAKSSLSIYGTDSYPTRVSSPEYSPESTEAIPRIKPTPKPAVFIPNAAAPLDQNTQAAAPQQEPLDDDPDRPAFNLPLWSTPTRRPRPATIPFRPPPPPKALTVTSTETLVQTLTQTVVSTAIVTQVSTSVLMTTVISTATVTDVSTSMVTTTVVLTAKPVTYTSYGLPVTSYSIVTEKPSTSWIKETSYITKDPIVSFVTGFTTLIPPAVTLTAQPITSYRTFTPSAVTSVITAPVVTSVITSVPVPYTSLITLSPITSLITQSPITSLVTLSPVTSFLTSVQQAAPVTITSNVYPKAQGPGQIITRTVTATYIQAYTYPQVTVTKAAQGAIVTVSQAAITVTVPRSCAPIGPVTTPRLTLPIAPPQTSDRPTPISSPAVIPSPLTAPGVGTTLQTRTSRYCRTQCNSWLDQYPASERASRASALSANSLIVLPTDLSNTLSPSAPEDLDAMQPVLPSNQETDPLLSRAINHDNTKPPPPSTTPKPALAPPPPPNLLPQQNALPPSPVSPRVPTLSRSRPTENGPSAFTDTPSIPLPIAPKPELQNIPSVPGAAPAPAPPVAPQPAPPSPPPSAGGSKPPEMGPVAAGIVGDETDAEGGPSTAPSQPERPPASGMGRAEREQEEAARRQREEAARAQAGQAKTQADQADRQRKEQAAAAARQKAEAQRQREESAREQQLQQESRSSSGNDGSQTTYSTTSGTSGGRSSGRGGLFGGLFGGRGSRDSSSSSGSEVGGSRPFGLLGGLGSLFGNYFPRSEGRKTTTG